ncbi:protection of telomeres protein 1b-like [Vicia villosa]|uniref:protection of telomeres protein 1b-like n=1 Tax=Vicia villosa TaxID=3911 RepID=UPI00273BF14A|nr:protection of telomeres protein 1b-like [Vicia villosa]
MSDRVMNDYKLLRLQDAHSCINQRVSIIAIVLEFGLPKTTRGTDQCCTLRLIDETHSQTGMAVNIFTENAESIPRVAAAGDIIHLSNVMLRMHFKEVNAVFYKNSSSFALYRGNDDDFVPYQVYSRVFLRDEDKMRINMLRNWFVNFQIPADSSDFPMLREIKEGQFNLAGKILHCGEALKDNWFVYVWDGTDTPPNCITSMLEDEINHPLPLQLESLPLPRDVLCTLPTVGSILRIAFELPIEKNHLNVLKSGRWAQFINIRLEVYAGLWYGVFTSHSKLRHTPDEDRLIIEHQRLYDDRILLKSGNMPIGSIPQSIDSLPESLCITKVNHDRVRHLTLMDVLTHSEVTAKFKCVVRVVAATPYQAEKFCTPAGKYMMRLTLEDPTARIHAFVVDEDGETLFDGYPGTANVKRKLNRLLGVTECDDNVVVNDRPRNPPWVSVCIKSYYVSKTDVWGSRNFRIFDTKIVDNPK